VLSSSWNDFSSDFSSCDCVCVCDLCVFDEWLECKELKQRHRTQAKAVVLLKMALPVR
jgi:hypothetical protein